MTFSMSLSFVAAHAWKMVYPQHCTVDRGFDAKQPLYLMLQWHCWPGKCCPAFATFGLHLAAMHHGQAASIHRISKVSILLCIGSRQNAFCRVVPLKPRLLSRCMTFSFRHSKRHSSWCEPWRRARLQAGIHPWSSSWPSGRHALRCR